jgi:inner membrane transporter RhtA
MAVQDGSPAQAVADRVPPVALVVAGTVSVQFGAALAATLFDDIGPEGATLLRLVLSAVVLVAAWRPAVRGRPRADLRLAAAFGLTLGLMNFTFYEALDRIPLGVAVTIEFAGPVAVAVALSHRRLDLLWVAMAAAGIVLLADPFGAGGLDPAGLAFALMAATCWAGYILLAQRTAGRFRGGEGLALASVVAALVPLGPGLAVAGTALLHPHVLLVGLSVAVLSSVIPYSLETEALRRMRANVFGVLMSLEPVVAAIAGLVVLGQRLHALDVLAMALVVVASIGVMRTSGPTVAPEA